MATTFETYDYNAQLSSQPVVTGFFHSATNSLSYVVADPETKQCAVIDAVLDFDLPTGTLSSAHADAIIDFVRKEGYTVQWILETHMHADHLSAAWHVKRALGGEVAIGNHITDIQEMYQDVFHVAATELEAARDKFDRLWADFDTFAVGNIPAFTFYAPGHTPADIVYGIGDALFVGDSLFMPDFGSARCDFPRGDAGKMYDSVQRIFTLPDDMRLFVCHDYLPEGGRTEYRYETTVGEQKRENIHLKAGTSREDFVAKREARDATLSLPKLMIPSLQVNVRAGDVPTENDTPMLRLPVNSIFAQYPKTDLKNGG